MKGLIETPYKLSLEEILTSAAATMCLLQLAKIGTPARTIDDVCLPPQYGFTASASWEPCGQRFVRITDIKNGSVDWDSVPFCECPSPNNYALFEGDILIARSGSVGKTFLVTTVPEPAIFASYMIRLRVKEGTVIPAYVYWCMQSQQFWQQIMGARRGSAITNINGQMLNALRFPFPSLHIQEIVTNFLMGYRDYLRGKQTRACSANVVSSPYEQAPPKRSQD